MRGDVGSLKEIIARDEYILEKVLVGGFRGKYPLHVAISIGQGEFVLELLTTKPELAEVLDKELGMPLHIASSKGHLEIVKLLANIDKPELVEVLDKKLGAALHIASSKGHLEIVKHLVAVSPGMCMARNREGNNPLHIAAMKGKVEVLQVLLRTSPQAAQVRVDQGYTILHLYVNYNQLESLNELLLKFEDPAFVTSTDTYGNNILHLAVFGNQYEKKKRGTLMIVSILMATIALQVGVNPPGGVWQDNSNPGDPVPHVVGKAITATYYSTPYKYFMYFNTVGFLLSLSTIIELIVVLPARKKAFGFIGAGISWLTIMTMAFTYTFSVIVVSPSDLKQPKSESLGILVIVIVWAVGISFFRIAPYFYKEILVFVLGFLLHGLSGGLVMMLIFCICTWLARVVKKRAKRNRASEGTVQSTSDTDSAPNPNAVSENESRVMIMP